MFGFIKNKKSPEKRAAAPQDAHEYPSQEKYEEFLQFILGGIADDKGVHLETALTLLGALAGFAAQMAVREKLIDAEGVPENQLFMTLQGANGQTYYTGDILYPALLRVEDGHTSVFKMTAGAAFSLGAARFPDMHELVRHVASAYGGDSFGIPRLPPEHQPRHAPLDMLRDSWDTVHTYLQLMDDNDPLAWPFILGKAIENLCPMSKGAIDPHLLVPLVMESALPMSHVDPKVIVGQGGNRIVHLDRSERGRLLQSDEFRKAYKNARKT